MTDAGRVETRCGVARLHAASIVALLAALVLLPSAARPSCQTPFCHHERDVYDRTSEAHVREELARDPADVVKWQAVLRELANKPARERRIARYVAHVVWEAQPELEIDLEARLRKERTAWIADFKQAFPDRGEPWCAEAELEESLPARIELLRAAAARLPDDAEVHRCLGRALNAAGRADEAIVLLQSFLDAHPNDAAIHSELVGRLRDPRRPAAAAELRAALEERARRLPDDPWARRDLLDFYDRNGLDAQRDRMLAEIEADGDFQARDSACSALNGPSEGSRSARIRCLTHLLNDFPSAELDEDLRGSLDFARRSLLMNAIHARDWPLIHRVLASWPEASLGQAWSKVIDSTKAEGCQPLRKAWSEGALRPALVGAHAAYEASRLSLSFDQCGDKALADEIERPFVADASDEELGLMGSDAARAEERRRAAAAPTDAGRWRQLDDSGRPLAERLPGLLAWHEADRADPTPASRLSRAYAAAGRGEEAVRWLVEAAARDEWRGEDLLLEAAALALRFHLHDAAAANARKVLAAPASPRQHAEAHYLLGRVALREGRREEAATELLRYFPLRMRYVGACDASPDRGLVMLLLANYDLPRLRVYLAERDAASTWYREHLHNPRPELTGDPMSVLMRSRSSEPLPCLTKPLPPPLQPELTRGCVPPGVYDYLAAGGPGAAPAGERARRRREAEAGTACPSEWPTDLEPLFEDERLLSFSEALTTAG